MSGQAKSIFNLDVCVCVEGGDIMATSTHGHMDTWTTTILQLTLDYKGFQQSILTNPLSGEIRTLNKEDLFSQRC